VDVEVDAAMAVLLGFQSVVFAAFTKVFAISEGLLPEDPRLARLFRYVKLETGLMTGFALIAFGLAATFMAVGAWAWWRFGPLDLVRTLRIVIPAALSLTLGFEIVLSSFFLSVLGMKHKGATAFELRPEVFAPNFVAESLNRPENAPVNRFERSYPASENR